VGRILEIVAAGLGLLLADWYAKRQGIETTWLLLLVDVIGAAFAAVTFGLVLAGVGRTAWFAKGINTNRRDRKR
jgi:hypothetical protein